MLRLLLIIATTVMFCTFPGHGQMADFFKEEITFAIHDSTFYVNGIYHLRARHAVELPLIYPFPSNPLYGAVDSIYIQNLTLNKRIDQYRETENGILFALNLDSLIPTQLLISYQQRLMGPQAEYILLSTSAWHKPLEKVTYRLLVPNETEVLRFSIEPDTMIIHGDTRIYYWERSNFLPDRNMVFTF